MSTDRADRADPAGGAAARRGGYVVGALINAVLLYLVEVNPGWDAVPFLTADTERVIGWVDAGLVAGVVTNLLWIAHDGRRFKALCGLVTSVIGAMGSARILAVFPFDLDQPWRGVVVVLLVIGVAGSAIGFLTSLGQLVSPGRHPQTIDSHHLSEGTTMSDEAPTPTPESPEDQLRRAALARLKKKRDFQGHLLAYVMVNALLIVIWATATPHTFFWPVFPLFGWGIGVAFNAWDVYSPGPSEAQVQAEMARIARR
ncbi:2TM domain-containing protein [Spongisporangium articulatum]|uniref:2TM domain-containing protein n=1 Tax=Spongisporangium articulatum TaxID=3362603 RepID=A0ABW8AP54_9ACTN